MFTTQNFPVNIGMNETFPWASKQALSYEFYECLGMMFCFQSEGSEYANSIGLGYVALGSSYDSLSPPFLSKNEMFQSEFSVARKPSESFAHWIECNPDILVAPRQYIRGGSVPSGGDLRLYDHCRTTLAVGGHTTPGIIIGELWVTYDVLLSLPKSDATSNLSGLFAGFNSVGAVATSPLPLGTSWAFDTNSTLSVTGVGTNTIVIAKGAVPGGSLFYFAYSWQGTAANLAYVLPAVSMTGGTMSLINQTWGVGGNYTATLNSTGCGGQRFFTVDGTTDAVITFAAGLACPANSAFWCSIVQVPRQSLTPWSAIFDPKGREKEKRYNAMMEAVRRDPDVRVTHVRTAEGFQLDKGAEGGCVYRVGRPDRAVPVTDKVLDNLSTIEDSFFGLLCEQLMGQ